MRKCVDFKLKFKNNLKDFYSINMKTIAAIHSKKFVEGNIEKSMNVKKVIINCIYNDFRIKNALVRILFLLNKTVQ